MVLPEETIELSLGTLHIFKDEFLQPLVAELQGLLLDRIEVIDPDHREGKSSILLLQVLLRVLLDLLHEQFSLFLAVA